MIPLAAAFSWIAPSPPPIGAICGLWRRSANVIGSLMTVRIEGVLFDAYLRAGETRFVLPL